ncbi:MAG TPA: hypothetical protein PKA58_03120 [Polyangium sp.]|nr:hypothetical protein [Polyangium sp.]
MQVQDVVTISRHKVWIEEPYAIRVIACGDLTEADTDQLAVVMDRVGGGNGPIIFVQDMSNAGGFTVSMRHRFIGDPRVQRITDIISYGTNFSIRVFMGLVIRALKAFNRTVPTIHFVEDEAAARQVLTARRQRLQRENH